MRGSERQTDKEIARVGEDESETSNLETVKSNFKGHSYWSISDKA